MILSKYPRVYYPFQWLYVFTTNPRDVYNYIYTFITNREKEKNSNNMILWVRGFILVGKNITIFFSSSKLMNNAMTI
jgi:hypothetical protein